MPEEVEAGVEELREVFEALSEFLPRINEFLAGLIDTLLSERVGDRAGRSVAAFYRRLEEAGLPEDVRRELVVEFFRSNVALGRILSDLVGKGKAIEFKISKEKEEGGEEGRE
ncbi:MAG: hypothetical protein DRO06_02835 [Thermoproteota archaeon]|nr:MAG: hypothetical protein DRO06_02835 [Candidatus Korarchaeota archaeon]